MARRPKQILLMIFAIVVILICLDKNEHKLQIVDIESEMPHLPDFDASIGMLMGASDRPVDISHTTIQFSNVSTPVASRLATFNPSGPRQLLILSYQRCGSSFFGDIFGRHPAVAYHYEPLDGVYVSLYGTVEGWNVPSDITSHSDGTDREPPKYELDAVTDTLDALLNCRSKDIPTEVLISKFWKMFRKHHGSLQKFLGCNSQFAPYNNMVCQRKVAKVCPRRFNGRESAKCYSSIHNETKVGEFEAYQHCIKQRRQSIDKCVDSTLTKTCQSADFRAVKTVRATMESVEELIKRNENLRVVHLIRDPRPVVVSRKKFSASSIGSYAMHSSGDRKLMDVAKEAKLYCSAVLRDIIKRRELEEKYPGRFMEVVYEAFTKDPMAYTEGLYEFIDVPLVKTLRNWLRYNTNTSKTIASKWHRQLSDKQIGDINGHCNQLFKEVSYDWL